MSKTIYINENAYKILQESILLDTVPEEIMNCIFKNQTSLKNNPAIPNVFEDNFIERIIKKRFLELKNDLKKIGNIDDFDDDKIESVLAKLILKTQKIEQQNKNELEKLCYNYVTNFFGVPEDTVTLELNLVETIEDSNVNIEPLDDVTVDYDDLRAIEDLNGEVAKRRLLNCLSMGAGMQISSNIKSYLNDIYDVNPILPDLYRKILALTNYLLFTKEDLGINDKQKLQFGFVNVSLGQEDEKPIIKAEGKIFPVLLSESIHGFMELFSSHGLPSDFNKMKYVINKTDFLKAEPWDMRIGPSLWTILSDSFEHVDSDLIPYVYRKIAMLPPKKFNKLMSEVLAKTKKGKEWLNKLISKAREEKNYNKFLDRIGSLQTDKNIINDEYIHTEEL